MNFMAPCGGLNNRMPIACRSNRPPPRICFPVRQTDGQTGPKTFPWPLTWEENRWITRKSWCATCIYLSMTSESGCMVVSWSFRPLWVVISTKYVMILNKPNLKTENQVLWDQRCNIDLLPRSGVKIPEFGHNSGFLMVLICYFQRFATKSFINFWKTKKQYRQKSGIMTKFRNLRPDLYHILKFWNAFIEFTRAVVTQL